MPLVLFDDAVHLRFVTNVENSIKIIPSMIIFIVTLMAASAVVVGFMAGFFGATIPLLLKKMDIDPAIGSTVILTTITDVVGFFSFLGLATIILL